MAKTLRASLIDQVKNAVVDDTYRRLYDKTNGAQNPESEVARQWADGPFSELEMIRRHGPLFLPCRRFGAQQGTDKQGNPKVRPIDDFSEYFHNPCVTSYDKVTVAGVDAIANFAKLWAQLIHQAKHDEDWRFSVALSTGEELRGVLHPGFREEESNRLVGKCLDLESAYRQLAVRPSQRHLAIFSLKNPVSGQVEFFECNALPFGASAAVHGFNRAAMALEKIMMSMFGIPCTHYFDDFSFIAPAAVAEPVLELAQEVLDLLGWEVKGETKDVPLDACFAALGVSFDLQHATDYRHPCLVVSNTENRVKELTKTIREFLKSGKMSAAEAAQLRGRLVFANSQIFGKLGAMAYHYLGKMAHFAGPAKDLDAELRWALD